MGKERSVVGTVIVTMLITAVAIVGGWFAWTQYLAQQAANAPHEEAAAPAPAPKRKPRTPKTDKAKGGPETASPDETAAAGTPEGAGNDAARDDNQSQTAAGRGAAPSDAEARGQNESSSAAAEPAATPAPAPAASASDRGDARAVMEEAQRRTEASFYQYDGLLQSIDAKDKITEKRWSFDRMGSHGQSKSVLRFTAPAEVKGVALLIDNHPDRASDQWMWTPALERDRRIALQDRSTRFFGTDFSFEDLEERDVDQYDYSMLGNDTIDGAACWKIQTTPKKSRASQYTRSIIWIRKDNYSPVRLDNFVKDDVVRRLTYANIENVQGIWTSKLLEMIDLHRGSRTRLTLQQVKYNAPMKKEDFTLQAIRQ